ncbi:unnamed protein product [Brassicogethes aeneus]|uniref:VPS37 C-terminal domain-containing protein n=1 Tax=Brassicogethes aeneus TaxID=1431903 RepID=A0A9P0FBJ1_BRAAE|nr:unnamed protein product [Brassicogethes aeneus]
MSFEMLQQDCKRAVNDLKTLSNSELDEIMNDDEKIGNLFTSLDQCYLTKMEQIKEDTIATNNSMAEYNLSKEPDLVEGRERIQRVSEEGEQLTKRVKEKSDELRTKTGDMSLETALALLQTAASEMEEESDKIARKFLDSEVELDDYLDQFLLKRKIMHLRLVKAEKLSKILTGGVSNYVNAPPLNINSAYFPGVPTNNPPYPIGNSVPYPTGPLNMPMPGMNYFQNHY